MEEAEVGRPGREVGGGGGREAGAWVGEGLSVGLLTLGIIAGEQGMLKSCRRCIHIFPPYSWRHLSWQLAVLAAVRTHAYTQSNER